MERVCIHVGAQSISPVFVDEFALASDNGFLENSRMRDSGSRRIFRLTKCVLLGEILRPDDYSTNCFHCRRNAFAQHCGCRRACAGVALQCIGAARLASRSPLPSRRAAAVAQLAIVAWRLGKSPASIGHGAADAGQQRNDRLPSASGSSHGISVTLGSDIRAERYSGACRFRLRTDCCGDAQRLSSRLCCSNFRAGV